MLGLRLTYLLALAVWLGGAIVLGAAAAPAVFGTLTAQLPGAGGAMAGAVFGAVLRRFHLLAFVCGALMLASLVGRALVGPRPRPYAARLALIGAMLVLAALVRWPLGRAIERVQLQAPGGIHALPGPDPRRARFERLHGWSNALMLINAAGGMLLLLLEARDLKA